MRLVNSELLPQQNNSHDTPVAEGNGGGGGKKEPVNGATQNNLSDHDGKELRDREREGFPCHQQQEQQLLQNCMESPKTQLKMNISGRDDEERGRSCSSSSGVDFEGGGPGEGVMVEGEDPDRGTDKSEDDDKTAPLESSPPSTLSLEMVEKGMTTEDGAEDGLSNDGDKEADESEAPEAGGITTVDFVAVLWILAMVGLIGSLIYFLVRLAIHS